MAEEEGFNPENVLAAMRAHANQPQDIVDPTMQLTVAEVDRARQVKAAVEAIPGLHSLSDFDIVQYALCAVDETMDQICHRVHCQQAFRQQYQIDDTAAQGVALFSQMTLQHPGMFLAADYLASSEGYMCIVDHAKFFPPKTDAQIRIHMAGTFYLNQALNPTFRAMRNGTTSMIECSGASFDNMDLKYMEKFAVEFFSHYPQKAKEKFFSSAESSITMLFALWNRFLPASIREKIHLGGELSGMDGQRIDVFYKQPTPEIARDRLCRKVLHLLTRRYDNQANFSLSKPSVMDG
ncbi:expressed unknown protein [Seminavis robusta]|uniref:CRAL-TRIO domain-containing protein n=1 Tax=Seminavis robusta TaxID=568900 RepID=A0A9N8EDV5_9STRA|nr:expressed unknown protein [Seminavis robusta]|eukprot:Sro1009_g230690.1 n/a (294) ;mRNA; r:12574-13455